MAVVKFCANNAAYPKAVLLLPNVSEPKDPTPTAVLKSASVRASPADPPIRVFCIPVETFAPALDPTAVLKLAVAVA